MAKKSLADFRNTLPTAMVMHEGPSRDAFLLIRGEYDKRGDKILPGLPAFLPAVPEGMKADRLGFARWIVSRDNPLTARAPRIRIPGEVVRDQAVAAAGLLVPAIGGPSVRPWMPDGVWDQTSKDGDLPGQTVADQHATASAGTPERDNLHRGGPRPRPT